jgi:acetyl esterase/lipase
MKFLQTLSIALLSLAWAVSNAALAQEKKPAEKKPAAKKPAQPALPRPTAADVSYGEHSKQVLHFWKAESSAPTPLLFYIHGGGWMGGNRASVASLLPLMLEEGISVVSVEYRFIPEAIADGVSPPVKGPLHDAARALQFVRSKASEWNIDKQPEPVRACGWRSIPIWPTRRAATLSPASRPGCGVRPSPVRRPHSTHSR